jgi:hypothetical protein
MSQMEKASKLSFFHILIGGFLLAGGGGNSMEAQTDQPRQFTADEININGRPANMFKLWENKQPMICYPLLASLNTPLSRKEQYGISATPRLDLPFMRNKFLVFWQKQTHKWHHPNGQAKTLIWDTAFLDLDGDGTREGLFRHSSMLNGRLYHEIRFVQAIDDRIADSELLDEETARQIVWDKNNYFPSFDNWKHHVELVQIGNRPYVMVAEAGRWSSIYSSRIPDIQLVKLTVKGWERVCGFQGTIEIIRHN